MAKEKWIDVQVSKPLYDKMCSGETAEVEMVSPKKKKECKEIPYLEVIRTGKAPEKKFENFKKVKFPTLCIYGRSAEQIGVINCALVDEDVVYELHDITKQHHGINRQSHFDSLEEMDEMYNIREIVKAKIIIIRGK